jgi:hypothetical protein
MTLPVSGWAFSDEMWTGERGERLEYAADVDGYAILRHSNGTVFYVDGLAGNYADRRGVFTGQWIVPGRASSGASEGCRASYTGIDGQSAALHGPLSIRFDSPAFPTGFEMAREYCEGAVDARGEPLDHVMTFHYFAPLTNAPQSGDEIDYGYNDPRPGRNQEQECLERLSVYRGAVDFSDLGRSENRAMQTWLITGNVEFQSGYQRRFECFHIAGRVERIVFGDGW